ARRVARADARAEAIAPGRTVLRARAARGARALRHPARDQCRVGGEHAPCRAERRDGPRARRPRLRHRDGTRGDRRHRGRAEARRRRAARVPRLLMEAVLLQVLAGLATGGIYASLALALVMIYQATHLVNFAQGEMAMFATYIAWSLVNAGVGYWPAFLLTVLIAFVLGVLIERVVIRPVENAPVLAVVVVFIGLLVILIRVGWMLALGWGLAAAVGAVAGMMVAPIVYLDPNMMSGILLYAFAAALLGGIDSPGGAVVGGLVVGVLENLLGAFVIGNELKLVVALVLIVGVLLVRPSGFFGSVQVSRV